ncbi:MAG: metal-dependent transcriptional regulator [Verrucomicrobiota bacterium]|nr:metal-dependent transcriptional regulator [Verrucomicrobiota bacterium]
MPTSTVENYVKNIYTEQLASHPRPVPMGRIASLLNVVPGTATTMVKSLAASGLVTYKPRVGVHLTERGEKLALTMLRKHRLVEVFLVKIMGYDWSEIHDDAERLEHAVSEKMLDSMDRLCGYPEFDPHGDPIPSASGKVAIRSLRSLNTCTVGALVVVARLLNQETTFLQFANAQGLKPGTHLTITQRIPSADALSLKLENTGQVVVLGSKVAESILVEDLEGHHQPLADADR